MIRRILAVAALASIALTGCSSGDPLAKDKAGSTDAVVVGSQQYYSNEIIAELYAQAIEKAGRKVTRQYQIGQREVYLPELKAGKIDVFPEYGGNLLQYLNKDAKATTSDQIATELGAALPQGLSALKAAEATDQDSYVVTEEYAKEKGLTTISDLEKVGKIKIAGNSELATRPYGPKGLKEFYGVDAELVSVEDSGGPLTVKALLDKKVQAADVYTSDPAIAKNKLVVLQDPKAMILPQQVTPIVSGKVDASLRAALEKVNAALTTDELRKLNEKSTVNKAKSADIAKEWLKAKGLL